jgi:putative DNA primase/helicase
MLAEPSLRTAQPKREREREAEEKRGPVSRTQRSASSAFYYDRADAQMFPNVPHELTAYKFWVCWKEAPSDTPGKKFKKIPLDPLTLRAEDWNNPRHWSNRATAVEVFKQNPKLRGIGWVPGPADPYGYFDLDHVIIDDALLPWAAEFVALVNSYTEISAFHDGVKIITRMTLPEGSGCAFKFRDSAGAVHDIEMYDHNHWFAATGNHYVGTPTDIRDAQHILNGNGRSRSTGAAAPEPETDRSKFPRQPALKSWAGMLRAKGFTTKEIEFAMNMGNQVLSKITGKAPYDGKKLRGIAGWFKNKDAGPREPGDEDSPKPGELTAHITSVRLSDVVPVPIDWLWEPYLQRDTVNGFYGNPGVGKGNTGMETIACLTVPRPFPGESDEDFALRQPLNVCVLAAEEAVENTITPRLLAAGADLSRVRVIKSIQYKRDGLTVADRMIIFDKDIAEVRADLALHPEDKFLYVDPITSYFDDINVNQGSEVRPVLQLLLNLADEMKITVLIVGHFNKNANLVSAIDKPGGAREWVAMCRAAWGFFRDPEYREQRIMASLKLNNAKESDTTIQFTIGEKEIGTKKNGRPWMMPMIVWGERTTTTADEIIAAHQPDTRRDGVGIDFVQQALANGPRKAKDVYEAAENEKISERSVTRACSSLGIIKYEIWREGWFWQLTTDKTPIPMWARNLNKPAAARRAIEIASKPS